MYTTGDKLLNVMKEEEIGIAELARISGVPERTILDIMAGVKEPELGVIIETTKTDAGTRVLPITEDVAQMFQAIIEDRNAPKVEKSIDGYSGFLFCDDNGMPLVAMHWQHRFNHMVGRYNDIYRVQLPNITPHVCRHTYCSNMAKSGMNPKTLQYLMGHSDISVTMNVYTHISFDDAEEELKRMEEFRKAQAEIEKKNDAKAVSQKMFKVV
jgi:site-specific recombinase XerD